MSDLHEKWTDALPSEIRFWEKVASGEIEKYAETFRRRCASAQPFPSHLRRFLRSDRTTRILDVGSGPHTSIGQVDVPSPVRITAVDPLADKYNEILERNGIEPVVRTIYGKAERVDEYGLGLFDFVYSRNALDHSYDPMTAIGAMLRVLDREGVIYLEGSVNEGEKQKYGGLHQWNFQPVDDDLVIWRQDNKRSLKETIDGIDVSTSECTENWYKVVIRARDQASD